MNILDLQCPICNGELTLFENNMTCHFCKRKYPILADVPILLTEMIENNHDEFEKQLINMRKKSKQYKIDRDWNLSQWKEFFYQELFPQVNPNFPQWKFLFTIAMQLKESCPEGTKILDIGAGECKYKPILDHCDYVSLDFAQLGSKYDFSKLDVIADALNIPFKDNIFDAVMSFAVLEHVPSMQKSCDEMSRVLKQGGTCHCIFPLVRPEHMIPYDYFRCTRYGIEELLSRSGLEVKELKESNGSFWTGIHYAWEMVDGNSFGRYGKKSIRGLTGYIFWKMFFMPLLWYGRITDSTYPKHFPIYFYVRAVKK